MIKTEFLLWVLAQDYSSFYLIDKFTYYPPEVMIMKSALDWMEKSKFKVVKLRVEKVYIISTELEDKI